MKAAEFIVIGTHSSQQNSWIEGGDIRHVVSSHRTESAAWDSADKAHYDLGGCDGSNRLCEVMQRYARVGSRKAKELLKQDDNGNYYDERIANSLGNYYEHAGYIYVECSFWDAHQVVVIPGGLGYCPR